MAYAKLSEDGRILMWSREKIEGYDTEFSNGDYVDEKCVSGLEDFRIEKGKAVYDPKPEKEVAALKARLADTDYIAAKIAEGSATRKEYAEEIAMRQAWRDRINELEGR